MSAHRDPLDRVILRGGNLEVVCDPHFGSAPLNISFLKNGKAIPLINSFPGAGAQATWDYGQDATQASPNGPLGNPLATLTGRNFRSFYYGNELAFSKTGFYSTISYCPAFWLSHEKEDDAIPPESLFGWRTKYLTPNYIPDWTVASTPIFWAGNNATPAGVMFVGNALKNFGLHWADRVAPFAFGNVAAKIHISLETCSADSYAGLLIRKDFSALASQNDAYNAAGLHFLVNRAGSWALHEFPGDVIKAAGTLTSGQLLSLRSNTGLQLEVRTYAEAPEVLQLLIDDKMVADLKVSSFGNAFGLIGSTTKGSVKFSDRYVYDLNYTLHSTLQTKEAGILLDYGLYSDPALAEAPSLYRANLGVFFLNEETFAQGYTQANGIINPGIVTFEQSPPPYEAISVNEKLKFSINALSPLPEKGHALLANNVIHFNNLSFEANLNPIPVSCAEIRLFLFCESIDL